MIFGPQVIDNGAGRINLNDTPLQIADCGLWLRADQASVLNTVSPNVACTDGQAVRRWADQSGNGRHFDQSTAANQPLWRASGVNGQPALDFDGVNDLLNAISGLGLFRAKAGATVLLVSKGDSAAIADDQYIFQATNNLSSSSSRLSIARKNDLTDHEWGLARRTDGFAAVTEVDGPSTVSAGRIAAVRAKWDAASIDLFTNGSVVTVPSLETSGITSNTDSLAMAVGAQGGGTKPFAGNVAEVIAYPRALTDSEMWLMHRYLSLRYNIPLAV